MSVGVGLERLVARTRPAEGPLEVARSSRAARFAWWRAGRGLVAEGVAARVPLDQVAAVLRGIDVEAGTGRAHERPVAVAALPFDPLELAQASMVVPARVWRVQEGGRVWVTDVSRVVDVDVDEDRTGARREEPAPPAHGAAGATAPAVAEAMPAGRPAWAGAVARALEAIADGEVQKVVLSRDLRVRAPRPLDAGEVVARLLAQQPGCFVFRDDDLVGATPELLVERCGAQVRSRPLAGTVPGTGSESVSWLDHSEKDRREHRLVVEAVVGALTPFCTRSPSVTGPVAQQLVGLSHLATEVTGSLRDGSASALDLARSLHPTPAVAGVPTASALRLVREVEGRPRGRYGGPVGWVDAAGDGEFALALRCGRLAGRDALLHAGAGIVAGSRVEQEWEETAAKFGPMLAALGPGLEVAEAG